MRRRTGKLDPGFCYDGIFYGQGRNCLNFSFKVVFIVSYARRNGARKNSTVPMNPNVSIGAFSIF